MKNFHLIVIAVIAGVAAVFMINKRFTELENKAAPKTVTFWKAAADLPPGRYTVQEAAGEGLLVKVGGIPEAFAKSYREAVDLAEYESGTKSKRIHRALQAGNFLLLSHLEETARDEIASRIPAGQLAISIMVNQSTAVSYLPSPGDVVDIYRIVTTPSADEPGGKKMETVRVAQSVRIFAVDAAVADPEQAGVARPDSYASITVAGPPHLIEKLLIEKKMGQLELTLRSSRTEG
ncbi:MAG: Flp pilus assembly protein CpaB [bacterium]|nr:Flp pilus assembly protein CpaB [bacterium]